MHSPNEVATNRRIMITAPLQLSLYVSAFSAEQNCFRATERAPSTRVEAAICPQDRSGFPSHVYSVNEATFRHRSTSHGARRGQNWRAATGATSWSKGFSAEYYTGSCGATKSNTSGRRLDRLSALQPDFDVGEVRSSQSGSKALL